MHTSTMTSKGQLTVPKEVRQALGLCAGDMVEFEQKGKTFIFKKRMEQDGCPVCYGEGQVDDNACFFCGGCGYIELETTSGHLLGGVMKRSKQIAGTVASRSMTSEICQDEAGPILLQVAITSSKYPSDLLSAASDFIQQRFLEETYPRDSNDSRYFESPSEEFLEHILNSFKTEDTRVRIYRWFRFDRVHPNTEVIRKLTQDDKSAASVISIFNDFMNNRHHIFVIGAEREARVGILQALYRLLSIQDYVIVRDEYREMDVTERTNQMYFGGGAHPVEAIRKLLSSREKRYTLLYPEIQEATDTLPFAETFFNGGQLISSIYCEQCQDVAEWIIGQEVGDPQISPSSVVSLVIRLGEFHGKSQIAEISEIQPQQESLSVRTIMLLE